jgi:hypothetical protein
VLLIASLVHSVETDRTFYSGIIPKGAAMRHRRLTPDFPARFPGEPRVLSNKQRLTQSQERRRIEGLRMLARIIARHYLANPHLYRNGSSPAKGRLTDGGEPDRREGTA